MVTVAQKLEQIRSSVRTIRKNIESLKNNKSTVQRTVSRDVSNNRVSPALGRILDQQVELERHVISLAMQVEQLAEAAKQRS